MSVGEHYQHRGNAALSGVVASIDTRHDRVELRLDGTGELYRCRTNQIERAWIHLGADALTKRHKRAARRARELTNGE